RRTTGAAPTAPHETAPPVRVVTVPVPTAKTWFYTCPMAPWSPTWTARSSPTWWVTELAWFWPEEETGGWVTRPWPPRNARPPVLRSRAKRAKYWTYGWR